MKKEKVFWYGLAFVLFLFMVACSGTSPALQTEEPRFVESVVTEQPAAPRDESEPEVGVNHTPTPEAELAEIEQPTPTEESRKTVSVTLRSIVRSSDLGGYAWVQEFLSSNDLKSADAKSLAESVRAGAVCYASVAPSDKSAPSAADGSFSVSFEAEPGSTFRIMCDPDETHPGALGIDEFTVPDEGGIIDHATAGFLYPGLWTPELGVANDLAGKAAGYTDAEDMFQSAGTCRVLALPGVNAQIAVSDGEAYGFYMEAPDTAGRVTMLTEESGAYIVIKEFGAGESEAEIEIEFTDTSGSGLAWPTTTCPVKKGFSTHLEVLPLETAADFTLPDADGNMVSLADELQENEQVVLVFYYGKDCTPCMAQLSEIENDRAKYEDKNAQVIAIAVQNEELAGISAKVSGAQFPILAGDKAVAEAYGVFESLSSGFDVDFGLTTPSVFIINKDRQIIWSEISYIEGEGCGTERVPSQTILENLG